MQRQNKLISQFDSFIDYFMTLFQTQMLYKFTLQQATEGHKGNKITALLSWTSALDGGRVVNATPRPL